MLQVFDSLPEKPKEDQHFHRVHGSGLSLATVTYGNPAQPALLLIHGAYQSHLCWRRQYTALAKHYYVVGVDLPWHGDSSLVSSQIVSTPDIWADSIRAVLVSLHLLDRPLVIGCWSFGGLVIRNYLCRYGLGNIKGLISIASALAGVNFSLSVMQEQTDAIHLIEQLMNTASSLWERMKAVEQFVMKLTKEPPDTQERYLTYGYTARSFLAAAHLGQSLMVDVSDDAEAFLARITVPVLLIQGQNDDLVPPALTQHTAEHLPLPTLLTYGNCGHSPFLEYSAQFNHDVQAFLHAII